MNSEQIVLDSVMLEPRIIDLIGFLEPRHFEGAHYGEFWSACVDMYNSGLPIDIITLNNHTGRQKWVIDVQMEISGNGTIAASAEHHAKLVKDGFVRRQVVTAANSIVQLVNSGVDTADLLGSAEKAIKDALEGSSTDELAHIGEALDRAYDALTDESAASKVLRTGIGKFDAAFGGLFSGLLYVWAARPSMGKTAFAANVVANLARSGAKVALFTLEDTEHFMSCRMMARTAMVDYGDLSKGRMNETYKAKLNQAIKDMRDLPMWICDKSGLTVPQIRHMCIRHGQKYGLDAVFVDHLGELGRDDDAYNTVSMASKGLRDIAKELDIPVVLLSQLNRKCESRPDKRPTLSDLRDSGKIEEVARMVGFLYRDVVYNPEARDDEMEFICRKNTNGKTGHIDIGCDLSTMSIW